QRYENCTCRATPGVRDAGELREWILEFKEQRGGRNRAFAEHDALLAAEVRRLAAGEELDETAPYYYEQRKRAVEDVALQLADAAEVDDDNNVARQRQTRSNVASVRRFWLELLSQDDAIRPKHRLEAFVDLRELHVLP